MNLYIEARVLDIADYIVETGATVRAAASVFGVSKSTVHKDITERLRQINKVLGEQVAAVLETNKDERHIRGGMATKEKYLHISEERNCAHTSDG
ncbi:MAG: sporulation transcriptional regulator SpoIIID [Clostridium sp.]|nr:sporulation transcriptional regulator SpoIIID [Clostridium sp.]